MSEKAGAKERAFQGTLASWARGYYSQSEEYALRLASKWHPDWLATFSPYVNVMRQAGSPEGVAVDVGCGGGQSTYLIAAEVGRVVGLDLSVNSLPSRPPQPANVSFVRADAMRLPLNDNAADVVGCYATLEHVPDAEQALREAVRVAKPGGWIVVYGPNMISPIRSLSLFARALRGRGWHPDAHPAFWIRTLWWNLLKLLGLRTGFLYRRPLVRDLSFPGSDYDAICLVSTFDLLDFARQHGLKVHQFAQGTSRVGRALAKVLPWFAGGVGLVARKPERPA